MRALILLGHGKRGFDSLPIRSGMSPGVVLFLGVVTMEKDRLPTVILLIFCVLAIILAECLVCLLGGGV